MPAHVHVLECEARGLDVEFYLNGIPLARRGGPAGAYAAEQVNEFLLDGDNALALLINPLPADVTAIPFPAAAARLVRYPLGARVGGPQGTLLAQLHWELPTDTVDPMHTRYGAMMRGSADGIHFPLWVARTVPLPRPNGTPWAWQSAEPVTYTPALRRELFEFLQPLHAALHAGDPEPFIRAGLTRLRELGDAYATFDPVERIGLIRKMTARQRKQPWWGLQPISVEHFAPRVCAAGRLVECRADDGLPFLRENRDLEGSQAYYAMFVSKIEGEWQIVR